MLNLANLAAMRGDQRLALHWLELLAQRQPDHPQLEKVRNTLFPNGALKAAPALSGESRSTHLGQFI